MADISNDVAERDTRLPSASARAASIGGGVALTTLGFGCCIGWVQFWEGDNSGPGCIICSKMELPLTPKRPPPLRTGAVVGGEVLRARR